MKQTEEKTGLVAFQKEKLTKFAPLVGLVLLVALFAILSKGKSISAPNLKILANQLVVTAVVAVGAVFSFSCGALDMSMSGSVCVCSIAAALVGVKTGSMPLMLATAIAAALALGLVKAAMALYMRVPVYILTIVMGMALSSLGLVLLGDQTTLSVADIVGARQNTLVYLIILINFYLVSLLLFNYYAAGKDMRIIGANAKAARQSGIRFNRTILYAFLMGALCVGLASIITLLRSRSVSYGTAGSLGTDMMVAIVLGGMPISGGMKSKISAGIIGAASITVLNNGLTIMGINTGIIQMVRGFLFLGIVYVTSFAYRSKLLPR